jgi:hypothetical protein
MRKIIINTHRSKSHANFKKIDLIDDYDVLLLYNIEHRRSTAHAQRFVSCFHNKLPSTLFACHRAITLKSIWSLRYQVFVSTVMHAIYTVYVSLPRGACCFLPGASVWILPSTQWSPAVIFSNSTFYPHRVLTSFEGFIWLSE